MRLYFSTPKIPSGSAKRAKMLFGIPESQSRELTAFVFGYRTWQDLLSSIGAWPQTLPDEALPAPEQTARHQYQASRFQTFFERHRSPVEINHLGSEIDPALAIAYWGPSRSRRVALSAMKAVQTVCAQLSGYRLDELMPRVYSPALRNQLRRQRPFCRNAGGASEALDQQLRNVFPGTGFAIDYVASYAPDGNDSNPVVSLRGFVYHRRDHIGDSVSVAAHASNDAVQHKTPTTAGGPVIPAMTAVSSMAGVTLSPVCLQTVLEEMVSNHRAAADHKAIGLSSRKTDIVVNTDAFLLKRILANLVSNAVYYTERGRVLLTARRCRTGVQICVWDTGIGINADDAQNAFTPGNRGNGAGRQLGYGLGLPIARRLCDALGAEIRVRSTVGSGSVFTVELPLGSLAADDRLNHVRRASPRVSLGQSERHNLSGHALEGMTVALIDHDDAARRAMAATLLRMGARVFAERNSAALMVRLVQRTRKVDVLLKDHGPDSEAVETAYQRCSQIEGFDAALVIISTQTAEPDLDRWESTGVPVLSRSVDTSHLVQCLARLRRSGQSLNAPSSRDALRTAYND